MMTTRRALALGALLTLAGGCATESPIEETPQPEAELPPAVRLDRLADRQIFEPQLVASEDGDLLLVWREKGEEGSNLWVSRRGDDGSLVEPVRVNDEEWTVESFPHDEMRVAVATAEGDRVAVAWTDRRGQVRAAVSDDAAASFASSVRLDQAGKAAYRGFPAVEFGSSGALHAIWIDSRHAEGFAEEPADLFYATVVAGEVTETNLTADQDPTVCGCCRTHLETASDGSLVGLFRNADAEGYRDIFAVVSSSGSEGPSPPERIGQPLWKLEGCPMAGPVLASGRVLWPDGSTGKKVLMDAGFDGLPARALFSEEERGDWSPRLSPRSVSSIERRDLVLLPGRSASRLVRRNPDEDTWELLVTDLPAWATTASYEGGQLTLVGSVDGSIQMTHRAL